MLVDVLLANSFRKKLFLTNICSSQLPTVCSCVGTPAFALYFVNYLGDEHILFCYDGCAKSGLSTWKLNAHYKTGKYLFLTDTNYNLHKDYKKETWFCFALSHLQSHPIYL